MSLPPLNKGILSDDHPTGCARALSLLNFRVKGGDTIVTLQQDDIWEIGGS